MFKMSHPSKYHRDTSFIGGMDYFLVTNGTTGLDNGRNFGISRCVNSISEWKKSIGSKEGPT